MKQTFTIPGRLPGMNELLGTSRHHWAVANKLKKQAMMDVQIAAMQARTKPCKGKVKIAIICYEPNKRRDQDNVIAGACKIILDALQEIHIIAGDGWKYIDGAPQMAVKLDRANPRIEVEIQDSSVMNC